MCMGQAQPQRPDWDRLYEIAAAQEGLFSTQQAADAGYSPQLLLHHLSSGRALRVQRGIYRLVHFPAGDHESLVRAWLWSQQAGILSHPTALALHGLSDAMPAQIHLTVPSAWERRRLRLPRGIVLHYAEEVPKKDRTWFGPVPVTSVHRTLNDCARDGLSPELLRQAAKQALQRGLVAREDLADVKASLKPFGGLPK
jgi:predicted transcriptional regulator of viral defense system